MKFNYLLRETQFHGGKRLAEKDLRCLWSVVLMPLFTGAAAVAIYATVQRFLNNPTYIVQEELVGRTLHFPSVFICPEILFLDHKINKFLDIVEIPPNLNRSYVKNTVRQLAAFFSPDVLYETQHLQNLEHLLAFNNMSLERAGLLLTTSCEETLIRCRWQDKIGNCTDLFTMELTGDGYCCVFNGRSLKRKFAVQKQKHKFTTRFIGFSRSLMLVVNQSQILFDVDLSYKWIALQSSQHFVESTINGTPLNPGTEQWAAYYIRNFQIGEEARILSDSLKKCRMCNKPLEYYPVYHRRYCIVECEMHRTLDRCHCVMNIHPRPEGAPYCRAQDLDCAKRAKVSYDNEECECPVACDVAKGYVKTSNFHLFSAADPLDSFYEGLDFKKVTIVRVFQQNRKLQTSMRWSYFNRVDLFAQLGGVFNLFFGCSILTMLELIILGVHWFKEWKLKKKKDPKYGSKNEAVINNDRKKKNQKVKVVKTIS